ncbi:MAG: hypothetical protein HAW63_05185 [Bdellovibrionaceae bacterium]|nr:hypothetical protein [Pseudobdellovibrionaceae bacterium]
MGIVLFLSFFPVLLSLCLGFNVSSQIIYYKQKAQYICQRYHLAHQKQLQKKIARLLQLNLKAKKMRIQLKHAKQSLKIAKLSMIPPIIATAQSFLAFVLAKQLVLFTKQKNILYSAIKLSNKAKKQLKKRLNQAFDKNNIKDYSYKQVGLAVYPKPLLSFSPSYYLMPAFSYAQGSYTFFYLNIKNLLPPLLQSLLPNSQLFKIKCSATLMKKKKIELTLWQY